MARRIATIVIAAALAGTAASAAPVPGALAAFLNAADRNDFAAMQAAMDRGAPAFIVQVRSCYLRRVYANGQTHEVVAAWMCAEGPNRSRVVLADIAPATGDKVSVVIRDNTTNNRPAPPRAGSALAP